MLETVGYYLMVPFAFLLLFWPSRFSAMATYYIVGISFLLFAFGVLCVYVGQRIIA